MSKRPLLLDLFCGQGGASVGYFRAGFNVVGVDFAHQPRYPFEFHQADALEFLAEHWREFDAFHASPPCQGYSDLKGLTTKEHAMLVPEVRKALAATGKPYVIENVEGAPLKNVVMLCGSMFGLRVQRHRLFECNPAIHFSPKTCNHWGKASGARADKNGNRPSKKLEHFAFLTIAGNDYLAHEGREAMGIEWMSKKGLSQAIPPAYTEWIGQKMFDSMGATCATL